MASQLTLTPKEKKRIDRALRRAAKRAAKYLERFYRQRARMARKALRASSSHRQGIMQSGTKFEFFNLKSEGVVRQPWGDEKTSSSESCTTIVRHVGDPGTTSGDFRHPNAHAYRVARISPILGHSKFLQTDLGWYSESHGDLARGPTWSNWEQMLGLSVDNPERSALTFADGDVYASLHDRTWGKLADTLRGGLDLMVDYAERAQTKRMVQSLFSATEVCEAIRYWRPHRWWLGFQYGIKPAMNSVYEAVKIVKKGIQRPYEQSLKEGASRRLSHDIHETVGLFSDCDVTVAGYTIHSYKTEVTMRLRSRNSGFPGIDPAVLDQTARLTSLNPMSTAWELLPYSFVYDWFIDIGGYLRGLETACLMNASFTFSGWESYRCRQSLVTKNEISTHGRELRARQLTETRERSRSVVSSFPLPPLPDFKPKLGWQRVLSAASLIRAALPQKGPGFTSKSYSAFNKMNPLRPEAYRRM